MQVLMTIARCGLNDQTPRRGATVIAGALSNWLMSFAVKLWHRPRLFGRDGALSVYADDQLGTNRFPVRRFAKRHCFWLTSRGEGNAAVRLSQTAHATESNPTAASLVDARTHRHVVASTGHFARHGGAGRHSFRHGCSPVDHHAPGPRPQMYIAGTWAGGLPVPRYCTHQVLAISVTSYNGCCISGITPTAYAMSDVDPLPLEPSTDELHFAVVVRVDGDVWIYH